MELTLCERLDQTPVIFLGEVVDGGVAPDEDPWHSNARTARVRVVEAFRGIPKHAHEVDIDLFFLPGMCAPNPYVRGKQVLVFTSFDKGNRVLRDGGCTQSISSQWIADDLGTVRAYFRGEMKTTIYGRVAPNTDAEMVDYVLSSKKTLPLAGAMVIAEGRGRRYQAVSDVDGKYSIIGLRGGLFQVHAELSGFENRDPERTIQLKAGSCAIQNFGLWTNNSVEGSVDDRNGSPVRGLHVFLQRAGATEKFGPQATTDNQGAFRFVQIDPGDYSVVVSPSGETDDSPYPRIASGAVFRVGPTSSINAVTLTLPPPIATHNIRIHVTGPDGKPVTEGYITCAQDGKENEGVPMIKGLSPKLGGTICHALSDRSYRIRLERLTARVTTRPPNLPEAVVPAGREDIEINLKLP